MFQLHHLTERLQDGVALATILDRYPYSGEIPTMDNVATFQILEQLQK